MSGGSFNYLYIKDADQVMGDSENLNRMIGALTFHAPDSKALKAAIHLRKTIEDARKAINDQMLQLSDVFKSVEWEASGDWNIDAVHETVTEFEGKADEPA